MKTIAYHWLVPALIALSTGSVSAQVIVYQNIGGTTPYQQVTGPSPGAAGDEVTLSGGANTITSFTVGLVGSGVTVGATADLTLNFYAPGPLVTATIGGVMVSGPSVGDQIGSTITQTLVPLQNGAFNFTFAGLSQTAPSDVIWAVSIENLTTGVTLGWSKTTTPPTAGNSDPTFAYFNIPGVGLIPAGAPSFDSNPSNPTSNLSAIIEAVPEPAAYPVLFAILCLGLLIQRRRLVRSS
jgi:hypothetical protein